MFTEEKKLEKVALAKSHSAADRLAARFFTRNSDNRGCSVGCDAYDIRLKNGDDWDLEEGPEDGYHAYVASYFGTPEWLEYLRDTIFEGLPEADRAGWHVNLAEALPVQGDFERARRLILRDILLEIAAKSIGEGDEDWRVRCRSAVQRVAALHNRAAVEPVSQAEWDAARAAAKAAGDVAGDAAGYAAEGDAAEGATARAAAGAAKAAGDVAEAAGWATRDAVGATDWVTSWAVGAAGSAASEAARSAAGDDRAARAAAEAAGWATAGAAAYQKIAKITLKHLREAGASS